MCNELGNISLSITNNKDNIFLFVCQVKKYKLFLFRKILNKKNYLE